MVCIGGIWDGLWFWFCSFDRVWFPKVLWFILKKLFILQVYVIAQSWQWYAIGNEYSVSYVLRKILFFCSFLDVFSWFQTWNHWKRFKTNKTGWMQFKKCILTSFWVHAAPKIWSKYTTQKQRLIIYSTCKTTNMHWPTQSWKLGLASLFYIACKKED